MKGPAPRIFEDPFAIDLLSPGMRRLVTNPVLLGLQQLLLGALGPMAANQVTVRSRFAEDALEQAMAGGVSQYVLLSAGLDSFALRRPDLVARLRVFEVDHPDTQRFKRAQLEAMGAALPANLQFAPVDFEREGIAEGLGRSSYDPGKRAFFSWLGTVPYLTKAAVFGTLNAVVFLSPPGSELVFDFAGPIERVEPRDRRLVRKLLRYTARRGEPLINFEDPERLLEKVCALGFDRVELLGHAEQERRYCAGRSDGLRVLPIACLVRLRRV
jgi:methyltransferase (TIGR00027 family)